MNNIFNIMDYGAVSDGKTDCTKAIQIALDKAGEVKGSVIVPPGIYLCHELQLHASTSFQGYHGWGYRETGGSVLKLADDQAKCLLNMTGAHGSKVGGLQFVGTNHGSAHGIMVCWQQYNNNGATFFDGYTSDFREDSILIDDCQIRDFGGDAIHLKCIFAFTIRNCHAIFNKGNGIYIDGWDGWIFNTIISCNGGYGLMGDADCSSITTSGNRFEWNRMGGIYLNKCQNHLISANCFDRNMGPAIDLSSPAEFRREIMIENNLFIRNGKERMTPFADDYENSHLYLNNCENSVISGNAFKIGRDDGDGGTFSPKYGIVYGNSRRCIISGNVMGNGATLEKMKCIGECEEMIIKDNSGINLPS